MKRCRRRMEERRRRHDAAYGFHTSPFGTAIVIASGRGLAGLAFADTGEEQAALADMQRRWPRATYVEDRAGTAALAQRVFDTKMWRADQPLRVVLIGTDSRCGCGDAAEDSDGPRGQLFDIASKIKNPRRHARSAPLWAESVSFVCPAIVHSARAAR